jgi:hypothetical protein
VSESARFRLAPILIEAFFVVLGVFLALVANEWQVNAAARERAASARASIVEEIRANQEATAASHAYHERLLDSLRAYFPPDHPPPSPALFNQGFVRPITLLTTAWEAANATDALDHMDYDEVLAFSKLYAMQRRYERSAVEAGSVIYAEIMERGVPGVAANQRNLAYIIGAFYFLEEELLGEYVRVLEALGEAP